MGMYLNHAALPKLEAKVSGIVDYVVQRQPAGGRFVLSVSTSDTRRGMAPLWC